MKTPLSENAQRGFFCKSGEKHFISIISSTFIFHLGNRISNSSDSNILHSISRYNSIFLTSDYILTEMPLKINNGISVMV